MDSRIALLYSFGNDGDTSAMKLKPDANTSQSHGILFENFAKGSDYFPGATNHKRSGTALHDIEGRFDVRTKLPASVKVLSSTSDMLCLADAVRFCSITHAWRLVVGIWRQIDPERKSFFRVHEFIITPSVMRRICGHLTPELALRHHNDIASYAVGKDGAKHARARAKVLTRVAAARPGYLKLNFKVDEEAQRRLQVSLSLKTLINIVASEPPHVHRGVAHPLHQVHNDSYGQLALPFSVVSTSRRTGKKRAKAKAAPAFFPAPTIATGDVVARSQDELVVRRPVPVRRDDRPSRPPAPQAAQQMALAGI